MKIGLVDRIGGIERKSDIQSISTQNNGISNLEKVEMPLESNSYRLEKGKEESESEVSKDEKSKRILEKLKQESKEITNTHTELKFGIHEATNQIMIKVIDSETSEVIKEIPSEKILDIMGKIIELSGLFVDEKR